MPAASSTTLGKDRNEILISLKYLNKQKPKISRKLCRHINSKRQTRSNTCQNISCISKTYFLDMQIIKVLKIGTSKIY